MAERPRPTLSLAVGLLGVLLLTAPATLSAVRPLVFDLTGVAWTNATLLAQVGAIYVVVALGSTARVRVNRSRGGQSSDRRGQSSDQKGQLSDRRGRLSDRRWQLSVVTSAFGALTVVTAILVGSGTRPLLLQVTAIAPVSLAYLVGVSRTSAERIGALGVAALALGIRYALAHPWPTTGVPTLAFTMAVLTVSNVVAGVPVGYLGWRTRRDRLERIV